MKRKKRERNFDESKDSKILECELSTLKNSLKKKKHKELEDCDVSFDSHQRIKKQKKRERNSDGLKDSNILESSTLKNNDKESKHKELEDCNVSFDSHQKNKKQKKREKNSDGLKDSNIFESSTLKNSHKESKHEELEDCDVSFDSHERIKKRKKKDRNFNAPNNSNILECEPSSLENSDIKEMKNGSSVSELEDNSSDSDDLIDDNFFMKERYRSYDLDDIEEPVNFPIPPLHEKESLKALTKEEKNVLKSQGVEIKQGKFSSSEDAILRENYEEFCSTFKVNNPYLLLGIGRYKKPKSVVLKFFKAKHFYVRLGKNLNNRSLYSVYQRARILFNPFQTNKIQKCNEEEIKEVMYYQKELGNKWHRIGALVEKTNLKVRKCFEWNSEDIKKGDWTPEEEDILMKAIHSLVKIPNLSGKHSNLIPWSKVADLVPTRNTSQCRLHWGECMAWEPDAKRKPWTKVKDIQLVDELISRRNIIVNEIDWKDVHKLFKDYAPSHMFLRKRFRKLKTLKKFKKVLEKSGLPLERLRS